MLSCVDHEKKCYNLWLRALFVHKLFLVYFSFSKMRYALITYLHFLGGGGNKRRSNFLSQERSNINAQFVN